MRNSPFGLLDLNGFQVLDMPMKALPPAPPLPAPVSAPPAVIEAPFAEAPTPIYDAVMAAKGFDPDRTNPKFWAKLFEPSYRLPAKGAQR